MAERLKREGRFKAYTARRRVLVAEGKSASEAYTIAASEFAPGVPATMPLSAPVVAPNNGLDATTDDVKALRGKPPVAIVRAVLWVFENIDLRVMPADAPSPGAWSLLKHARSDRAGFYDGFVRALMPSKSQVEQEAALKDDGHERIGELLDRALERLRNGTAL